MWLKPMQYLTVLCRQFKVKVYKKSYLSRAEKMGVSNSVIVHFKFEDTINIGKFEVDFEITRSCWRQVGSHEGINTEKFQLDILVLEWSPYTLIEFLNLDGVNNILFDGVGVWWFGFSFKVVFDVNDSKNTALFEGPLGDIKS